MFRQAHTRTVLALVSGSAVLGAAPMANGQALLSGETVTEMINSGGIDFYTFDIADNSSLFVGLNDTDSSVLGSDPTVTIFDGNGTQVFQQSTNNAYNQMVNVAAGGTLQAVVESTTGGEYSLQLTSIPGAQTFATGGGSFVNGTPVDATLARGEADTYVFSANAGDTFFLGVRDADSSVLGSDPRATLFQPDGTQLFQQSTNNFFVTPIVATQSGEYSLVVAPSGGGGGDYAV